MKIKILLLCLFLTWSPQVLASCSKSNHLRRVLWIKSSHGEGLVVEWGVVRYVIEQKVHQPSMWVFDFLFFMAALRAHTNCSVNPMVERWWTMNMFHSIPSQKYSKLSSSELGATVRYQLRPFAAKKFLCPSEWLEDNVGMTSGHLEWALTTTSIIFLSIDSA